MDQVVPDLQTEVFNLMTESCKLMFEGLTPVTYEALYEHYLLSSALSIVIFRNKISEQLFSADNFESRQLRSLKNLASHFKLMDKLPGAFGVLEAERTEIYAKHMNYVFSGGILLNFASEVSFNLFVLPLQAGKHQVDSIELINSTSKRIHRVFDFLNPGINEIMNKHFGI